MKAQRRLNPKALMNLRWAMFNRLRKASERDAGLKGLAEEARKLWSSADAALQAHKLRQAEKDDKGVILWEVFHPRTTTPLACSLWDLQRRTTRTPGRLLEENRYYTTKSEWRIAFHDPWVNLDREWHEKRGPFDLAAFRNYARDIDEVIRRDARRRDFRVTDDNGHVHEVRCETEAEARRRVVERLGGPYVVKIEEAA